MEAVNAYPCTCTCLLCVYRSVACRYQIRFLLRTPLAVNPGIHDNPGLGCGVICFVDMVCAGQLLEGSLSMEANAQQSYTMHLRMTIAGTDIVSDTPDIDLKVSHHPCPSTPLNTMCVFFHPSGP